MNLILHCISTVPILMKLVKLIEVCLKFQMDITGHSNDLEDDISWKIATERLNNLGRNFILINTKSRFGIDFVLKVRYHIILEICNFLNKFTWNIYYSSFLNLSAIPK